MKVKAIWEFEVDTEDFLEEFVDIKGLAKDLTQKEMLLEVAKDLNGLDDEETETK